MYEYAQKEIWLQRDSIPIFGLACIPAGAGPWPTVVIGHGYAGNYEDNLNYADYLARRGIASYSMDFIGGSYLTKSGGVTTDMSVMTETADMKAVVEQVRRMDFVDPDRLFLLGESQGGFVAALTAAAIPTRIRGLILLYPAFVIQDNGKAYGTKEALPAQITFMDVRVGPRYYADIWDLDLYAEIAGFTGPVLLFHGTEDELVPLSYSRRAAQCYRNAELVVVPGQGHGFYGPDALPAAEKIARFISAAVR